MIDAIYFDGQTARPYPVTVLLHKGALAMRGDGVNRSINLRSLCISERLLHAPRILRFPDGGVIQASDRQLDRMLRKNGYRDPRVVRWQQNWPLSLLALISLLAVLIGAYQWGLPWAIDKAAQHVPTSIEQKIGDAELTMIDARFMQPSQLDPLVRLHLQSAFAALKQPRTEKTAYRLEFRHSPSGPNAFALPNGVIVMTDQLALLAENDQALQGVLAHELGHVQRRHTIRHLMQALGVGMVVNLLIGDVSSALALAPTVLLHRKYSRDFEREADQYAIDMLQANQVPLSPMAALFEKMRDNRTGVAQHDDRHATSQHDEGEEDDEDQPPQRHPDNTRPSAMSDYLSTHPSDAERIARLRAADGR